MSRPKGSRNSYVKPAKDLAWERLTEEQKRALVEEARQNFKRGIKRRSVLKMSVEELEEALQIKTMAEGHSLKKDEEL